MMYFQTENKLQIAEAIVLYHDLVKKVAMLDNFAKGLETLGILDEIKKNPRQFEPFFLYNEQELVSSAVMEKTVFKPENANLKTKFENFLLGLSKHGTGLLPFLFLCFQESWENCGKCY